MVHSQAALACLIEAPEERAVVVWIDPLPAPPVAGALDGDVLILGDDRYELEREPAGRLRRGWPLVVAEMEAGPGGTRSLGRSTDLGNISGEEA